MKDTLVLRAERLPGCARARARAVRVISLWHPVSVLYWFGGLERRDSGRSEWQRQKGSVPFMKWNCHQWRGTVRCRDVVSSRTDHAALPEETDNKLS